MKPKFAINGRSCVNTKMPNTTSIAPNTGLIHVILVRYLLMSAELWATNNPTIKNGIPSPIA